VSITIPTFKTTSSTITTTTFCLSLRHARSLPYLSFKHPLFFSLINFSVATLPVASAQQKTLTQSVAKKVNDQRQVPGTSDQSNLKIEWPKGKLISSGTLIERRSSISSKISLRFASQNPAMLSALQRSPQRACTPLPSSFPRQ